jgi:two-component system NarL family sensor kinase
VKRLFNEELFFGEDGYFFVYDSQGVNLVHPVKPDFVGKPKLDLQDSAGSYVVQNLLAQAKRGSGLVPYRWIRPSTGQEEYKVGYARMLEPWQWMVGTGLYDVNAEVERNLQQASSSVQRTFHSILWLLAGTILVILALVLLVNLHESRMADRHLRELVHNFIQLQVEERRRFARELHDGINQLMVAAKFRIELALRQMSKGSGEYADTLATALATLDESIREVRRISHGLRPDLLDEMGLEAALERLAGQFHERTGIRIHKQLDIQPATMPDDVAIMLYRVVQEALTNIERHASASEVGIRLHQGRQEAQLDLHDNGAGFDPTHLPPGKGIGLKNMRERVELLGGQLRLESAPGRGTRIHATLPLDIIARS